MESTARIVPMGGLTELDFVVEWRENNCSLKVGEGRTSEVTVMNGCAIMTRADVR